MVTLCPIALTAGCTECVFFKLCPAKTIIGNYRPDEEKNEEA